MRGSSYTIFFAVCLSATCAVMLSGIYMLLKERQDENRALEKQMSILSAAGLKADKKNAQDLYHDLVQPMAIDKNGNKIDSDKEDKDAAKYLSLYVIKKDKQSDELLGYVYPVVGAGLWSELNGFLAVDETGKNILGLTFYKQGETPGLGAEIEKAWFTDNFKGKTLFDGDKLVGVKVAKGKAQIDPEYKYNKDRMVDGISGATITGDGVTSMLLDGPRRYEPFFQSVR